MTQICVKWLKYVGKWLNYLTNGLKMWKMTQRFGKWPTYFGNCLDAWGTASVFDKRLNYVKMALEFGKRLKYMENDECIWEMA